MDHVETNVYQKGFLGKPGEKLQKIFVNLEEKTVARPMPRIVPPRT